MNKNMIIVIVLAILVLITAVQAVQLNSLKNSISSGKVSLNNAPSGVGAGGDSSASSLNELPSMVGGC